MINFILTLLFAIKRIILTSGLTCGLTCEKSLTSDIYVIFIIFINRTINKSAITYHVAKENHVIDWSVAKILDREGHRRTRQLKESIRICKEANCMNRDAGAYNLPTTYDRILVTSSSLTSRDHMPDKVRN